MLITGIVLTGGIVVGVVVVVVNAIVATFRATNCTARRRVAVDTDDRTCKIENPAPLQPCCYRAAAARKVLWRSSGRLHEMSSTVDEVSTLRDAKSLSFRLRSRLAESFLVVAVYVVVDVVLVLTAAIDTIFSCFANETDFLVSAKRALL